MGILYILFFIFCCIALYYAGNLVLESLSVLGKFSTGKNLLLLFYYGFGGNLAKLIFSNCSSN